MVEAGLAYPGSAGTNVASKPLTTSDVVTVTQTIEGLDVVEPFVYEPLQKVGSIRILTLLPADIDDHPLQSKIKEVLLRDRPQYEGVSYAWGQPIFSQRLQVNDACMVITESLSAALRRFRLPDRERSLWVDAVCINQKDLDEKSKQVALMGKIYRNCQRTLVWLGSGDQNAQSIVALMKHLATMPEKYGLTRPADGKTASGWAMANDAPAAIRDAVNRIPLDFDWTGADEFYSSTWFSRLWVVQEISLAPVVVLHYGSNEITWDELAITAQIQWRSVNGGTAMNVRLPHGFTSFMRLEEAKDMLRGPATSPRLMILLNAMTTVNCFDDRDRIYALLSLRASQDVQIWPDYHISPHQLYSNTARTILTTHLDTGFKLLYYGGLARRYGRRDQPIGLTNIVHDLKALPTCEEACATLPSWVPDWTIMGTHRSIMASKAINFAAGSGFAPKFMLDPVDGSVEVAARLVGFISEGQNLGSETYLDWNAHRHAVLRMKEFFDRHADRMHPSVKQDPLKAFARTIIADNAMRNTRAHLRQTLSHDDLKQLWQQFAEEGEYKDDAPDRNFESDGSLGEVPQAGREGALLKPLSQLFCYRMALRILLDDRQFIVTKEGRIGLVPAIAQPGDMIAIVAGSGVPLVVRPSGEDENGALLTYVIGDCYLYGVMYGELQPLLKAGKWNLWTLA